MPDAPWRCSQCGTVNEPVANSCRTCGRWPSLFDLEQSTIEVDSPAREEDVYANPMPAAEVEQVEPNVAGPSLTPGTIGLPQELEPADDDEVEESTPKPLWRRLTSFIVPLAVILYILITMLANRG